MGVRMVYFTEAQREFCSWIREFVVRELTSGAKERAKLEYVSPEAIKKLADAGLLELTSSARFSSQPRDFVTMGILVEEICKVDFSLMIVLLSQVLVYLMMEWISDELREELLRALPLGERFFCFANTEPDCGSDATAIRTRAERNGNFYTLHGEKTSISGGMQADTIILTAKTNPDLGAKGVSLFYIPMDSSGISRSRFKDMGSIPAGRASISLNGVHVPIKFLIGEEGEGFSKVMRTFDFSRVLVGLSAIGLAEASLAEAVEYVKQREAFGVSLSKFEGVSFKLAEDATHLEASRLLCYEALKLRDEGLPHNKEAAMAKWFAPKCAVQTIHDVLLLFGHRGYSEAYSIERRWRDAFSTQIGDGTAEIMKLIIAREILGGKFGPTM
jgi:cyclohexanecarboxyl-CoA dehydrogenase